jgi:hypothetical protein
LFEFQDDGVAFLEANQRALLGDEPEKGQQRD